MIGGKTVLALIPARAGSKRLPGKNLKPLSGKPLIAWTIEAAFESAVFDDVVVSTDDAGIAAVAKAWKAQVPWLRPAELATDTATSMDVVFHALAALRAEARAPDLVVLLQPTSPFRTAATIARGVKLCASVDGGPVVAVSPAEAPPSWFFNISAAGALAPVVAAAAGTHDAGAIPAAYVVNGLLYVAGADYLAQEKTFFGEETRPLVISDRKEALDIDDEWDWRLAQYLCSQGQ